MEKLTRLPDWDRRLAATLTDHIRTPSEWGKMDCILRAADAVMAVTGTDLAEDYRGKYSNEIGAAKLLKKLKCENVEQLIQKYFEPVGRLKAQRGDLVTVEDDGVIAVGYVTEYGVAVSSPTGTSFRPQTSPTIRSAYKVGR